MPTFDFANLIRKVLSATLSFAASPLTAVLAVASVLTALVMCLVSNSYFPDISLPSQLNFSDDTQLLELLLYCINYPLLIRFFNYSFGFISHFVTFVITFAVSSVSVIVTIGAFRVVRRKLRDFLG